jgi:hypothetical protein
MNGPYTLTTDQVQAPVEALLESLTQFHLVIDCPQQIRTYLRLHPELIPCVAPTIEHARREFGDEAELTLTINDDPESYDPYLKLYVSLPRYGPDTMSRIDSIQQPLDEATADMNAFFLVSTDHRVLER